MNTLIKNGCFIALLAIHACKKDDKPSAATLINPPVIEKLSRPFVQAGEELTVYGSKLLQKGLQTEVLVNGKPGVIIRSAADSITVRVPEKALTGNVTVIVSKGEHFMSTQGPQIEIKQTPVVKGFWPLYATGGDTIALISEHFSDQFTNNQILLGSTKVEIVAKKGKDTLLVKLPTNAVTGYFSWNTYNGPYYSFGAQPYRVRQTNYTANTVMDWIYQDPAFSYMDTLVRGYPLLAGGNYEDIHKRMYAAALQYIQYTDSAYTIFLPSDASYLNKGTTKEAFLENILSKPYNYNILLIAAISPNNQLHISDLEDGDTFRSAFTMKMNYPEVENDEHNYIKIVVEDGVKYAQIYGMYEETRPRVKILKEHRIGKAVIIEIEGELGYVYF